MGVVHNIGINKHPKQNKSLGSMVEVCFNYNTRETIKGIIIRDDGEDPGETFILTEDGRILSATECQYSFVHDKNVPDIQNDLKVWFEMLNG